MEIGEQFRLRSDSAEYGFIFANSLAVFSQGMSQSHILTHLKLNLILPVYSVVSLSSLK